MQIANERMKTIIEIKKSGQSSRQRLFLITGGRDLLQRRAEIARVSVRQTLDGHGGSRGRLVGHSWGGGRYVSSRNGDYGTLGILVEEGWSGGWSDGWRSGGISPLIG